MLQIIYVDAGNTRVKCAMMTSDGWEIIGSGTYAEPSEWTSLLLRMESDAQIYFTSVSDTFEEWLKNSPLHQRSTISRIDTSHLPASRIDYETPNTLGADRWLACAGAYSLSRQAVVVISAGTAITVDLMDQHGVFRGGVIMPGLDTIEASAHHAAPRLPIADVLNPIRIPARSTDDSVDAGARFMVKSAINDIIQQYEDRYGMLRLWVSGGRAETITELLGRDTRSDSFLIFRGMREIIDSTSDF
jgi:type III pantothenate kinase